MRQRVGRRGGGEEEGGEEEEGLSDEERMEGDQWVRAYAESEDAY